LFSFGNDRKRKPLGHGTRDSIAARQEYHCNDCGKPFNQKRRYHVDHVDGDRTNNDPDNLQALCATCHDNKTREENSERSRKKKDDPYGFGTMGNIGFNVGHNSSKKKNKGRKDDPYGLGNIGF
jgi:hypothetical protein